LNLTKYRTLAASSEISWLRRYKNQYDEGWDVIRKRRLARMQELGIVGEGVNTADRLWFVPRPSMLAPGARVATGRKMEIYVFNLKSMVTRWEATSRSEISDSP
jgi:hypothetical protein